VRLVADESCDFSVLPMKSKLALEARQALLEDTQCLTPEERLNAFLEHCQLMMALYEAGQQLRSDALRESL
jgi:hypothetical protein